MQESWTSAPAVSLSLNDRRVDPISTVVQRDRVRHVFDCGIEAAATAARVDGVCQWRWSLRNVSAAAAPDGFRSLAEKAPLFGDSGNEQFSPAYLWAD